MYVAQYAPCAPTIPRDLPVRPPCINDCSAIAVSPPTPEWNCDWEWGCDDVNGDGSLIVPYIVRICLDIKVAPGAPSTEFYTTAGAPYTPVKPVACPAARDIEIRSACFRVSASGDTLTRITFYNTSVTPHAQTAILWEDDLSGNIIPAPAPGSVVPCADPLGKVPVTVGMYPVVPGSVAVPANARREFEAHNRSPRDVVLTWTGTTGGGGSLIVPASGTKILSLTESPAEGLFATLTAALGSFGVGAPAPGQFAISWKN